MQGVQIKLETNIKGLAFAIIMLQKRYRIGDESTSAPDKKCILHHKQRIMPEQHILTFDCELRAVRERYRYFGIIRTQLILRQVQCLQRLVASEPRHIDSRYRYIRVDSLIIEIICPHPVERGSGNEYRHRET
jgi:hypothetical protein